MFQEYADLRQANACKQKPMPNFKLMYFPIRGRAELSRLIFAQAGVQYEDKRLSFEEWGPIKPTAPWGKMPILELDGKMVAESIAIARYAARATGLAGKDSIQMLQADSVVDAIVDVFNALSRAMQEKDADKQAELKQKNFGELIPTLLANCEKFLVANDGGDGFLVGKSLTWADIAFFNLVDALKIGGAPAEILQPFPTLEALANKVGNLPNIKKWVESRPETKV